MKRASPFKLPAERVLEAENLTAPEVRFTVANYYMAQDQRKRADMQMRHLGDKEPLPLLNYMGDSFAQIEAQVKRILEKYASGSVAGRWLLAQYGVGPVIASGLLAHIDIEKAPTAGHIWRYAGLDPTSKWEKKQKRPWNAELKQICWHAGECFKRTSNADSSFYGKLYRERKQYEIARNESGGNAERAKTYIVVPNPADTTVAALAAGKLPDGQIDRQATRWAVKIFLSHLHTVLYFDKYKQMPPKPFALAILGHVHGVEIPHVDLVPGLGGLKAA